MGQEVLRLEQGLELLTPMLLLLVRLPSSVHMLLGGAAVSVRLVFAPVWPIVACMAGRAGIGYAAYKAIKYWTSKPEEESS